LNLENGETWDNPSSYQIEEALGKLEQTNNSFLILERDSDGYMQVAGNEESGYYLEYRSASSEKQYRCVDSSLSFEASTEILKGYAAKNRRWRTSQEWEEVKGVGEASESFFSRTMVLAILGLGLAMAVGLFESQVERWIGIKLEGKVFPYILTVAIGMMVPQSIKDLMGWSQHGVYVRTNAIAILIVFLTMVWASIYTLLGW
jgi:hypothetical protein